MIQSRHTHQLALFLAISLLVAGDASAQWREVGVEETVNEVDAWSPSRAAQPSDSRLSGLVESRSGVRDFTASSEEAETSGRDRNHIKNSLADSAPEVQPIAVVEVPASSRTERAQFSTLFAPPSSSSLFDSGYDFGEAFWPTSPYQYPRPGDEPFDGEEPDAQSPDSGYAERLAARRRRRRGDHYQIGNFFGAGSPVLTIVVPSEFHVRGTIVSGQPGSSSALLAFERDGFGFANDFTNVPGTGRDTTGDDYADTFNIVEPLPPNEVPTSPGPGFTFDGGTAVYTIDQENTTPQDGAFADGQYWYASYSFSQTLELPPIGGLGVRRVKIGENNSPIPRDRYYFDYRFFNGVAGGVGDVSRFVFGFEKTFFYELVSLDTRLPFAYTLDSERIEGEQGLRSTDFGNMAFILKAMVYADDVMAATTGLGISVPTGSDTRLFLSDGQQVLFVKNEAVHLQPYAGAVWRLGPSFYVESFLEVDIPTNGNTVRGSLEPGPLPQIGVLQDSTLLAFDVSGAYWFHINPDPYSLVRATAGIMELHYTTALQDADIVATERLVITDQVNRLNSLNCTLGIQSFLGDSFSITGGLVLPLRGGNDRQFDHELGVIANLFF